MAEHEQISILLGKECGPGTGVPAAIVCNLGDA